jgi:hypothetical protein
MVEIDVYLIVIDVCTKYMLRNIESRMFRYLKSIAIFYDSDLFRICGAYNIRPRSENFTIRRLVMLACSKPSNQLEEVEDHKLATAIVPHSNIQVYPGDHLTESL